MKKKSIEKEKAELISTINAMLTGFSLGAGIAVILIVIAIASVLIRSC